MTNFTKTRLTSAGLAFLGEKGYPTEFTKVETGDGVYQKDEDTAGRISLKDKKQEFKISKVEASDSTHVVLKFVVTNKQLMEGYLFTEIGVYAKDSSGQEFLYAICTAEANEAERIRENNGIFDTTLVISLVIEVKNADDVRYHNEGIYVLDEDFRSEIDAVVEKLDRSVNGLSEDSAALSAKNIYDTSEHDISLFGYGSPYDTGYSSDNYAVGVKYLDVNTGTLYTVGVSHGEHHTWNNTGVLVIQKKQHLKSVTGIDVTINDSYGDHILLTDLPDIQEGAAYYYITFNILGEGSSSSRGVKIEANDVKTIKESYSRGEKIHCDQPITVVYAVDEVGSSLIDSIPRKMSYNGTVPAGTYFGTYERAIHDVDGNPIASLKSPVFLKKIVVDESENYPNTKDIKATIFGHGNVATGASNITTATGILVEGKENDALYAPVGSTLKAVINGLHIEGTQNKLYTDRTSGGGVFQGVHIEGYKTQVVIGIGAGKTPSGTHVEGVGCSATGSGAHAEGYYTESTGKGASSGGCYTRAQYEAQKAIGKYNDNKADSLFEVGNGTSDSARSNALEVKKDGTVVAGSDVVAKDVSGGEISMLNMFDRCRGIKSISVDSLSKFLRIKVDLSANKGVICLCGILGDSDSSNDYCDSKIYWTETGDGTGSSATVINNAPAICKTSNVYVDSTTGFPFVFINFEKSYMGASFIILTGAILDAAIVD